MKGREKTLKNLTFFIRRFLYMTFYPPLQAVFLKRGEINGMEHSIILSVIFPAALQVGKKLQLSFDLNRLWIQIIRLPLTICEDHFQYTWMENEAVYIADGVSNIFLGVCQRVFSAFFISIIRQLKLNSMVSFGRDI